MDALYDRIWSLGLWLRNRAKRASILGPIEPRLLKLAPRLIPAPNIEVSVRLPWGMTMKVPAGYPVARSYSSGLYEPEVTRLFNRIVRPGMSVVDAGANIGYYSMLASHLSGPEGRVYAFEPDPLNFDYLVLNLQANGCASAHAVRTALASANGTGQFIRDSYGSEGYLASDASNAAALDVPIVTLDGFFQQQGWPAVHIIKIDVEGSEASVLEGMRELSRRNGGLQLIMELNVRAMSRSRRSSESLAALLRDLGFASGYIIEAGLSRFSLAVRLPGSQATYNLLLRKDEGVAIHV